MSESMRVSKPDIRKNIGATISNNMKPRIVRKIRLYFLSLDTLSGVASGALGWWIFSDQTSNELSFYVTAVGLTVALAMFTAIVSIYLKFVSSADENFAQWLNREFDSLYDDFVGALKSTAVWVGISLVSAIGLSIWSGLVKFSDVEVSGVPPALLAVFTGLLLYTVVAVVQCLIAVVDFYQRKKKYREFYES